MEDIRNIYIDLECVLSKKCTLSKLLTPAEIYNIEKMAEKNRWSIDTVLEYIQRYIRENISDYLDNSDFTDSNIILESDPHIVKAMELMDISQRHAQVLLVDRNYKYPGCWVIDIAKALRNLKCKDEDYNILVWDAYYVRNFENNKKIPGWENLVDVLDNYYNAL